MGSPCFFILRSCYCPIWNIKANVKISCYFINLIILTDEEKNHNYICLVLLLER
jgi:hypothetical protein